jgi:60 kDa SS-A/Ro ribonucleoprotein
VEFALQSAKKYDHIMLFTDCQLWDSQGYGSSFYGYHQGLKNNSESPMQNVWKQYRRSVNPNAKLYLFNLSDYGDSPVRLSSNGASMICGWSDHIFQVLADLQRGKNFIDEINSIEI